MFEVVLIHRLMLIIFLVNRFEIMEIVMIKMFIENGLFKHWVIVWLIKHIIELWFNFMMLFWIEDLVMEQFWAIFFVRMHVRLLTVEVV